MNEEFFKIVISTISGFFIAFAAEPVKTWSNHQHRKKLTKIAIYREIVFIYDRLIFFDQMSSQGKLFSVNDILGDKFFVYEYLKQDPLLFYELKESSLIDQVYGNLEILKVKLSSHDYQKTSEVGKLILKQIEIILLVKGFDKNLLLNVSKGLSSEKRLKQLLNEI